MSLQEKLALFTFVTFLGTAAACSILIVAGPEVLNWEIRHIFLVCLSLTAVTHIVRLFYYGNLKKSVREIGSLLDERDREIRDRANGIALKIGIAVLLLGSMVVFIKGTYCDDCPARFSSILLVVLIASLVLMISQSSASLLFYRAQRITDED